MNADKVGCFRAGTGLGGATQPDQLVTSENIFQLPQGSVVRLEDGSRLINLHDGIWLWNSDCTWCYDKLPNHLYRLEDGATLEHIPISKKGK